MNKKDSKKLDIIGILCGVFLLVVLVVSIFAGQAGSSSGARDADIPDDALTLNGTAPGRNGEISVQVVATQDKIYKVAVTKHSETASIGTVAVDALPGRIYQNQSLLVDGVTGATISSDGILDAVRNALISGGLDDSVFDVEIERAPVEAKDAEYKVDVVVIGAGGAGMSAAIEAADAGRRVLIVESMPMVGGNSVRSTGGMNAGKTEWQDSNSFGEQAGVEKTLNTAYNGTDSETGAVYADNPRIRELADIVSAQWEAYQAKPEGYFDSVELFQLDTLIGGHAINDPSLVKRLAESSEDAIAWLGKNGADLHNVGSFGGASVKRIHRPVDEAGKTLSVGAYLVPILQRNLRERGVTVLTETTAQEILLDSQGAAVGIVAVGPAGNTVTVHAKSVVIASGGFGHNNDMIVEVRPELDGFITTNSIGIQGQGIKMAQTVGAATVDMAQIQLHPTVHVEGEDAILITEGLRGDGAILVNQEGERFYDEVSTRDKVSNAEFAQTGGYAWLIIDSRMYDKSNVIQGYVRNGYACQGDSYEALAKELAIADPAVFAETVKTWNGYVTAKSDPDFGRTSFAEPLDQAPYYAIKVQPGIHHTMGGLKINDQAEVISSSGSVIPGLYAAGEVTGGVHGGNRLGGNAVADFVIFGRIAGQNASRGLGLRSDVKPFLLIGLVVIVLLAAYHLAEYKREKNANYYFGGKRKAK